MTDVVSYALEGAVGIIRVNNPPVNALSYGVRAGIADALSAAADDASEAVVILCDGRTFIAGADITEFGKPPKAPYLPDLLNQLDNHPKLTVAAIHGTALGGGFETALSCNYRVALASAKVGLPEVKLGLLPGAGGTQRTPRLAGVATSIELMTSGNPIPAEAALQKGLIDHIARDDLAEEAIAYAEGLVADQAPQRQASAITLALDEADRELISKARSTLAKKTRGESAPQRIIDCIEASAELDFDAGLKRERELFMACMEDPQSAALRHMFFAERAAAKIDGIDTSVEPTEVKRVGIIGAGTMGGGIAMCFAQAGVQVTLIDMSDEAVAAGISKIKTNYDISVKRGRLSPDQVEAIMSQIKPSTHFEDLADADMVIEAVFENLAVKKEVFARLDTICKQDAVLASNTSYQSIDDIAAATSRPESVLGMHFFSPANVMKLLEVVKGDKSSDRVIATAMSVGKRIGKTSVLSGMCYGFIGNRMLRPYAREAALCMMEGASPSQIDAAMENWGMAMGPLAVGDLAGLDIGYKAREQLSDEQKGDPASYRVADRLVEAGRLGQKSGAGYYRYDPETRQRMADPEVDAIIDTCRDELGIVARTVSDEEIVDRLILALANEGARILDEGIAQRASDIDVVYCYGYGFPRHRGGPMHYVQARGLTWAVERMTEFQQNLNRDNWSISALIAGSAERGEAL